MSAFMPVEQEAGWFVKVNELLCKLSMLSPPGSRSHLSALTDGCSSTSDTSSRKITTRKATHSRRGIAGDRNAISLFPYTPFNPAVLFDEYADCVLPFTLLARVCVCVTPV